jgi:hypothetical protein
MQGKEIKEALESLQDSVVDLPKILEKFPVDHVHWLEGGAPLPFRLTPEVFRERMPISDDIFHLVFNTFYRMKGLPGSVSHSLYQNEKGAMWPIKKALRFKEIDFRIPIYLMFSQKSGLETPVNSSITINTTHLKGTDSVSQVWSNTLWGRNLDYLVFQNGQNFINTMLSARLI